MSDTGRYLIAPNAIEDKHSNAVYFSNPFMSIFQLSCDLHSPLPRNDSEHLQLFLESYSLKEHIAAKLGANSRYISIHDTHNIKRWIRETANSERRGKPPKTLAQYLYLWALCIVFHGKKPLREALGIEGHESNERINAAISKLNEIAPLTHPYRSLVGDWGNMVREMPKSKPNQDKAIVDFAYFLAKLILSHIEPSEEKRQDLIGIMQNYKTLRREERQQVAVQFSIKKYN